MGLLKDILKLICVFCFLLEKMLSNLCKYMHLLCCSITAQNQLSIYKAAVQKGSIIGFNPNKILFVIHICYMIFLML